jgi:hypothetical protein
MRKPVPIPPSTIVSVVGSSRSDSVDRPPEILDRTGLILNRRDPGSGARNEHDENPFPGFVLSEEVSDRSREIEN